MKPKLGFTLMELLIVVSLIAILVIAGLALLNPFAQIGKAYDSRRKHDLGALQKAFEDYYNDKGCYPPPTAVCYPNTQTGYNPLSDTKCYICGNETGSPDFSPYLARLPCDPQHSQKKFLYQIDNSTCPKWYRLYSELSSPWSGAQDITGCGVDGCGPAPNYGYDYAATSPNISVEKTPYFYCYTTSSPPTCDNCSGRGSYEDCYANPSCTTVYATEALCCKHVPKPFGCP